MTEKQKSAGPIKSDAQGGVAREWAATNDGINIAQLDEAVKPAYWAVLPATVRYSTRIPPAAKLLYAEISALCDMRGACYAQDDYFAELYGMSKDRIKHLLADLEREEFIRRETSFKGNGGGRFRMIYCTDSDLRRSAENSTSEAAEVLKIAPRSAKNSTSTIKRIQEEQYKGPTQGRTPAQTRFLPDRFEALWRWYPSEFRGHKDKARKAWDKLQPTTELADQIAAGMALDAQSRRWREGIGIPNVSTYLNGHYWEEAAEKAERISADAYADADAAGWADDPEVY